MFNCAFVLSPTRYFCSVFVFCFCLVVRNECQGINRMLENEANFAAWTRVADDPESMLLAKNIGDYLG